MDKFEHKLRTTLHTRSVENIMTRTHAFLSRGKDYKLSHPKFDNISTYLRKVLPTKLSFKSTDKI